MSQDNDQPSGSFLPPPPPPPPPEYEGAPDWGEKPKRKAKRDQSGEGLTWFEVWRMVVTQPGEESFETVLDDPQASARRGYTWVFVVAIVTGVLQLASQSLWGGTVFNTGDTDVNFSPICGVICLPVAAALAVLGVIIFSGIQNFIARLLGGQGEFDSMAYSYASFSAPISVISGLLGLIPYVGCFGFFVGLYGLVLNVFAVKVVHRLDTGRALLTVFWWIPIGCVCLFLFICVGGAAVGNVFQNIIDQLVTPTPR